MTFGLLETKPETSVIRVRGAENIHPFLETFAAYGHVEIDTARLYARGDTEVVLSQLPNAHLKLATKAFPFSDGAFSAKNLPKQFRESLEALKVPKVDLFYLHAPDFLTPFEETLKAVNDLYQEGLFDRVRKNLLSHQAKEEDSLCVYVLICFLPADVVWSLKLRLLASGVDAPDLQAKRLCAPDRLPRVVQSHFTCGRS